MIVTCNSCQTRFRIPDDRVGPKGARVRCSRCQALFLVRREEPPPLALPEPAPARAEPQPAEPPPAAARPAAQDPLDLDLTGDPFALSSRLPPPPPPADPFAAAPAGIAPALDPFAERAGPPPLPANASPFAAAASGSLAAVGLPFGTPPPGDPFGTAGADPVAGAISGTGGIALEEGERRHRTAAPTLAEISQADLASDFRTPGPSGLEVDDGRLPEPPTPAEPVPAVPIETVAAPPQPPAPPPAIPRPAPPAPEEPAVTLRGRAMRRALSVLLNSLSLALLLVLAGALYVYWSGGGKSALLAAVGRQAAAPFEEQGVSSGLYDTARGRPVLFVRGRVQSRAEVRGPVRVRVELLDGKRRVAQGEGILGAIPSPEEIWSLTGPAEAERLRAALAARAPARLAAGEAPLFLVVLWDYPADLRGLDLRVVTEPGPPG